MSHRRFSLRFAIAVLVTTVLIGAAGCGAPPPPAAGRPTPEQLGPESTSAAPSVPSISAGPASPTGSAGPASPAGSAKNRWAFPVVGNASYARTHHNYPASDIMAPCGATMVSPVNGVVLEVNRVDTYDPKADAGPTRGGLFVSILGEDGARYYGSHFSTINAGIEAGTPVQAGQPIAIVGKTGDAGACHVHFGLSPVCARTGDWWVRRGVIWPWPYLDAWRGGVAKSPVNELKAWEANHGCPAKPPANSY